MAYHNRTSLRVELRLALLASQPSQRALDQPLEAIPLSHRRRSHHAVSLASVHLEPLILAFSYFSPPPIHTRGGE